MGFFATSIWRLGNRGLVYTPVVYLVPAAKVCVALATESLTEREREKLSVGILSHFVRFYWTQFTDCVTFCEKKNLEPRGLKLFVV